MVLKKRTSDKTLRKQGKRKQVKIRSQQRKTGRTRPKLKPPMEVTSTPSVATPITLGRFEARQCLGCEVTHGKPFLGIADMAGMDYCEIAATISQVATQDAYRSAAFTDDRSEGVGRDEGHCLTAEERHEKETQLVNLLKSGRTDWETRRSIGVIKDSLEMSSFPTERRHYNFGDFFVIGVPDRLSAHCVTEFVASRYPDRAVKTKQIQVNLYAVLWKSPAYHVIAQHPQTGQTLEIKGKPNLASAEQTIARAWELLSGREKPTPPDNPHKCPRCRYHGAGGCPYPHSRRIPDLVEMERIASAQLPPHDSEV